MTSWEVTIFGSRTNQLLDSVRLYGVRRDEVRVTWGLPGTVPPGELPITNENQLAFVNNHLETPLTFAPGREAFLGEVADYLGEVVTEADGTRWYPPPNPDHS